MQKMTLYNFLTRKKEILVPMKKNHVGLYTCGPTVYNVVHIGNLRTYIFEDILRRSLERAGYDVAHIMNITDVEDKIIRDARAAKQTITQFTAPFERAFFDDLKKLNITRAHKYPKATKHIKDMIALIKKLLANKRAYEMDSSIYFDISAFAPYGALSGIQAKYLKSGVRIDADEYEKHNVQDFVLWKAAREGEPSWNAPFGKGRPGWHIECSAMSMRYLGETFDIHAGAVDLLFPHHENEIAQSEGATNKPFVRFFVEGEHLLVDGKKMSKSLGNMFTLRDVEKKEFDPLAFRYLVLGAHYRSKLNFTWKSLEGAEHSLKRLYEFVRALKSAPPKKIKRALPAAHQKTFNAALSDDLDTPKALAVVWKLVHEYNKQPARFDAKEILAMLYEFDKILGLRLKTIKREKTPKSIQTLAHKREEHRANKEWSKADAVRDALLQKGWIIEDTSTGPALKKI